MALSRRCDDARVEDPRPEPITAFLAGGNPDVGELAASRWWPATRTARTSGSGRGAPSPRPHPSAPGRVPARRAHGVLAHARTCRKRSAKGVAKADTD
jgi:hypothetical protein